jgi:hypothetical protein
MEKSYRVRVRWSTKLSAPLEVGKILRLINYGLGWMGQAVSVEEIAEEEQPALQPVSTWKVAGERIEAG